MAHARSFRGGLPRSGIVTDPDGRSRTVRGKYAAELLRRSVITEYEQRLNIQPGAPRTKLPEFPDKFQDKKLHFDPEETYKGSKADYTVSIVGAGVAGLYLGMMLEDLKIPYTVYEAQDVSRVGGRIFTYNFPEGDPDSKFNYYDVGPMRFPKIPAMQPTFDLFTHLNVETAPYYLDTNPTVPQYIEKSYNPDQDTDPMKASFQPLLDALVDDFETGFQLLTNPVNGYDQTSSWEYFRQYLLNPHLATAKVPTQEIYNKILHWETIDSATGLFNQAFSETVLDYYDFGGFPKADWYRIPGGVVKLAEAMLKRITGGSMLQGIHFNTPVTAITRLDHIDKMRVTYNPQLDTAANKTYDAVFCTATLGSIRRMDLGSLPDFNTQIGKDQYHCLRVLQYDVSVKVAILFKEAWWVTKCRCDYKGGVSSTDLPIRTVVYPSLDSADDAKKSTAIIISYTWAQDANRISSLVGPKSPSDDSPELLSLVLDNLCTLFAENENWVPTVDELTSLMYRPPSPGTLPSYHAYSWDQDPWSSGAFALFGPGQFSNIYPALRRPIAGSNNQFYMCGEAVSAHHAWISGALYSAATALYTFLIHKEDWERVLWLLLSWYGQSIQDPPIPHLGDRFGKVPFAHYLPDEIDDDVLWAIVQMGKAKPTDDKFQC